MERILRINTERGLPGIGESIDCQHYEWKKCPIQIFRAVEGEGEETHHRLRGRRG